MKITFRPCTEEDARYVGSHLREQDRLELERATGGDAVQEAVRSFEASLIAWTMVSSSGTPLAIFGASPQPTPGCGAVWLVGTPEVNRAGKTLVQQGRYYVDLMSRLFPVSLGNFVDLQNTRTRAWLKLLGFREGAIITSPRGHPFVFISYSSKDPHVQRGVHPNGGGSNASRWTGTDLQA